MPAPREKLATSLEKLALVQGGRRVLRSEELSRTHRERLLRSGFLKRASNGWLFVSSPADLPDDATGWYGCFWEFCAQRCRHRFGDAWHLSAEGSILRHAGLGLIPRQVIVCSPLASNHGIDLPHDTSLFDLKAREATAPDDVVVDRDGLRLLSIESALVSASERFLKANRIAVLTVLAQLTDHTGLLARLLDGAHSTVAGRLAGAFRSAGQAAAADDVLQAMRRAGFDVREASPWDQATALGLSRGVTSPAAARVRVLWNEFRGAVVPAMPDARAASPDPGAYLTAVDDSYRFDAYHSLSIEGYRVSPELIERVRSGAWNPESDPEHASARDAMAALGYWRAFRHVRAAVGDVLAGADPASLLREQHRDWHRELFAPSVDMGLVEAGHLGGYRRHAVFLSGSRYVPMNPAAVPEAMAQFFDLLEEEQEPWVRAALGHFMFAYVHPYPDGNGRMARFIMNLMLASGGYPWTVIRVEDRREYMAALESASVHQDIRPFASLVAERVTPPDTAS